MKYIFNEGSIDLPDGWGDNTINAYVDYHSPNHTNIVITREKINNEKSFEDYITAYKLNLDKNFPNHQLLRNENGNFLDKKSFFIELTRMQEEKLVHQVVLIVEYNDVYITITLSSKNMMDENLRNTMLNILRNINLK